MAPDIVTVCSYCLGEHERNERPDIGYKFLEVDLYDGESVSGIRELWIYKRPDHEAAEKEMRLSHAICPFHLKRETAKLDESE